MTKQSQSVLKRKIERLESQLNAEKERSRKAFESYGHILGQYVDLKTRVEQANLILNGDDK